MFTRPIYWGLICLTVIPYPAGAHSERSGRAVVNPDGYTSARVCGECHIDIYNSWKNSLHAFSLTDPIFDTAFMQAVKEGGEQARRTCLRCHAPMTMMNGDYELRQDVSREGVSCDFCHTVTAVDLNRSNKPYVIALGLVKRGDIKRAASPAHEVAYSELHSRSEFCGGCHNYVTPGGAPVMSTFDEWRQGPYAAEGVDCQDCHMVLSAGRVVTEAVKRSPRRIHLHRLIHDSDQLRRALTVRIANARRAAGSLNVDVVVENVGSGHMIPTGIPTREVVLKVTATIDGYPRTEERRYRKVVGDKRGRPLKGDSEILLHGARILNDNRIAPREARVERFRFPIRGSGRAKLEATLAYLYAPAILDVKRIDIQLGKVERLVP